MEAPALLAVLLVGVPEANFDQSLGVTRSPPARENGSRNEPIRQIIGRPGASHQPNSHRSGAGGAGLAVVVELVVDLEPRH
jgi:hypothetical protein